MKGICSLIMLLGRLCLSSVFLWSGFYKIFEFQASILRLQQLTGITNDMATWVIIISLIVEIVFGILLVLGWLTRFSAAILAIYTLIMLVTVHPFWVMEGLERSLSVSKFLSGVGVIGGLLYILSCGAGCCSCDAASCNKDQ